MKQQNEIKFIKHHKALNSIEKELTPSYTLELNSLSKIVQINLDNCVIQRMELLTNTSTIEDVKKCGLFNLVEILQKGNVYLTALGIHEMPNCRKNKAIYAYENFCNIFWKNHKNDKFATSIEYDNTDTNQKLVFENLSENEQLSYGIVYICMLHIQNIFFNFSHYSPENKFKTYIYGIIQMIDIISAFELEIAKYAFWELTKKDFNDMPKHIHERIQLIKKNFTKHKSNFEKCKEYALNATFDIVWLRYANLIENLEDSKSNNVEIAGKIFKIENWLGTTDDKLYKLSRDMYSTSRGKLFAIAREDYLTNIDYWRYVDSLSREILETRLSNNYISTNSEHKIKSSILYLYQELEKKFNSN